MGYTIEQLENGIAHIAHGIIDARDRLEAADAVCGDGDLGISMKKGMEALLELPREQDAGKLFIGAAMALNRTAPSTMGTLISIGLMRLGKKFSGQGELSEEDVVGIPRLFAEAIIDKGGAKVGDRTVLDALVPCADAMEAAHKKGLPPCAALACAVEAARTGVEATRHMPPAVGRARWTPENAKGEQDAGALLCLVALEGILNTLNL